VGVKTTAQLAIRQSTEAEPPKNQPRQVGLWQGFRGVTSFRASDGQPGSNPANRLQSRIFGNFRAPVGTKAGKLPRFPVSGKFRALIIPE
jgi:hypothetical protein